MKLLIGFAAMLALTGGQPPAPDAPAVAGTLLIGNKGEDTLSFVDLATGRELGRAATGRLPHEIAISPDGRQAAVVSYGARGIDIFDVATRARLRTIDLSPNDGPHGIAWLPDGRIVVTTERSQSVAIVDTRSGDAVSAISTGQEGTHMIAVSPDGRTAYTANMRAGSVSVIDLAGERLIRNFRVGGVPEGIALSPDGATLWIGDNEGAVVRAFDTARIAADTRSAAPETPLAVIRTGPVPIRVLTSPDGRWVVTSNMGAGSLTLIDAQSRTAVREIEVGGDRQAGQVTILFSADGQRIYAAETGTDRIAEIDVASDRVLRRLAAGRNGDGLAIAP